ncbi:MAG: hypothetical protein GY950_23165 [bacterium]|nr:hypothetical protein [bacterium]
MKINADKTQENKSEAAANRFVEKQSSDESAFRFVDNRPEAIAQRKLQERVDNSPRVKQLRAYRQMADNSPRVKRMSQLQAMMNNREPMPGGPVKQKKAFPGIIQRDPVDSYCGTFNDKKYDLIDSNKKVDFELEFTPNDKADATKVGLTQTVKSVKEGDITAIDPNAASKMTPEGHRIDVLSDYPSPLYATKKTPDSPENAGNLEAYSTYEDFGQHAEKGDSGWTKAILKDTPAVTGGNNSSKEFEATALAIEGNDKDTYYGSVKWGWEKNGSGDVSKIDFDIVSKGVPSKNFLAAAEKWNVGKARGPVVAKEDDTKVYDGRLNEVCKLKKGDEAVQKSTAAAGNKAYVFVEVATGDHATKEGYIEVNDLEDKGTGSETVDLPLVDVKVTKEADVPLYKEKEKTTEEKKLPLGTRMKVISEGDGMAQIEIVDGPDTAKKGWLEKSKIEDEA